MSYKNEDPVKEARTRYEQSTQRRRELIGRISRTDSGDEFLRRTGAYGLQYQPTMQDRRK